MIVDKKTVYENGCVAIVRISSYGHGCNTLSVSWHVMYDGEFYWSCGRLKSAKKIAAGLIIEAA
jgi:hypothetical protein